MTDENERSAWLPLEEGARILAVGRRTVLEWVRAGILKSKYAKRKTVVLASEVYALAHFRKARIDVPTTLMMAQQALAESRRASEEVAEIRKLLGLSRRYLDVGREAVLEILRLARDALAHEGLPPLDMVRAWSDRFFGIDETFLRRAHELVGTDEPWKPFIDLGAKLHAELSWCEASTVMYLDAAREHLRQVAYFYCHATLGLHAAYRLFGASPRERILLAAAIAQDARPRCSVRSRRRRVHNLDQP